MQTTSLDLMADKSADLIEISLSVSGGYEDHFYDDFITSSQAIY